MFVRKSAGRQLAHFIPGWHKKLIRFALGYWTDDYRYHHHNHLCTVPWNFEYLQLDAHPEFCCFDILNICWFFLTRLNVIMTEVDPSVMAMFTQDYGLTAQELTKVVWRLSWNHYVKSCLDINLMWCNRIIHNYIAPILKKSLGSTNGIGTHIEVYLGANRIKLVQRYVQT